MSFGPRRAAAGFDRSASIGRGKSVCVSRRTVQRGSSGKSAWRPRLAAIRVFPVDLPWPRPGEKTDWSHADAECQDVLAANPNALLFPRIGMDPPEWWRQSYPEDVMPG